MLKRLRDLSIQPAEPPAKRAKRETDSPKANLHTLPLEVRAQIVRDATAPDNPDMVGELKNLLNIKLTSRALNETANFVLKENFLTTLNTQIKSAHDKLSEIPLKGQQSNERSDLKLVYPTDESAILPLMTAKDRNNAVKNILSFGHKPLPKDVVNNLIRNIEYTDPELRAMIVDCVRISKGDLKYAIKGLIGKAEHLAPEAHAFLVEESRDFTELWASKMDALGEEDQSKVLSHIIEDDTWSGDVAGFAAHVDKMLPKNRSLLVKEVVELDPAIPGRREALSHLARNLNCLNKQDCSTVVSNILGNLGKASEERIDQSRPRWHPRPAFHELEAVHHLSTHGELLSSQERDTVNFHIDNIVDKDDAEWYAAQSQLIPHLSDEKRIDFVRSALNHPDNDIRQGVVTGLTMRIKNLTPKEINEYTYEIKTSQSDDFTREIVRHNMSTLKRFTPEQRSIHLDRHLANMENDPVFTDLFLDQIAKNARHLRIEDVNSTIDAARRAAEARGSEMTPNDCVGHAARCLANWSREALANAQVYRENAPVPGVQVEQRVSRGVASIGGYEERPRELRSL